MRISWGLYCIGSFFFTSHLAESTTTAPSEDVSKEDDLDLGLVGGIVVVYIALAALTTILILLIRRAKNAGAQDKSNDRQKTELGGIGDLHSVKHGRMGYPEMKKDAIGTNIGDGATDFEYETPDFTQSAQFSNTQKYACLRPTGGLGENEELVYDEIAPRGFEWGPDAVQLQSLLHCGSFHEVYRGTVIKAEGSHVGAEIVVKKNKERAPGFEHSMLANEIKALKAIGGHDNIVYLLAQCTHKDPLMAILLREEKGNLKTHLRESRSLLYENSMPQTTLLEMTSDVAKGMAYLADLKPAILHRCLSAEHVLVSKTGVCKVTGFGFAEHVRDREEYERANGIEQAVCWMAPEQLKRNEHTKKSDVWAFGVLVWEIYSIGDTPYPDMSPHDIKRNVLNGCTLVIPQNTPDAISKTMLTCWATEEHRRPAFAVLVQHLQAY